MAMASDVNGKEPYLHVEGLQKCKWLLPELQNQVTFCEANKM